MISLALVPLMIGGRVRLAPGVVGSRRRWTFAGPFFSHRWTELRPWFETRTKTRHPFIGRKRFALEGGVIETFTLWIVAFFLVRGNLDGTGK